MGSDVRDSESVEDVDGALRAKSLYGAEPPLIRLRGRKRDDTDVVDSESIEDVDGALRSKLSDIMYHRPLIPHSGRKLDDSDVRDSGSVEDVDGALRAKSLYGAKPLYGAEPPLIPSVVGSAMTPMSSI